jgi:hypothetical protein
LLDALRGQVEPIRISDEQHIREDWHWRALVDCGDASLEEFD